MKELHDSFMADAPKIIVTAYKNKTPLLYKGKPVIVNGHGWKLDPYYKAVVSIQDGDEVEYVAKDWKKAPKGTKVKRKLHRSSNRNDPRYQWGLYDSGPKKGHVVPPIGPFEEGDTWSYLDQISGCSWSNFKYHNKKWVHISTE